MGPSQHDSTIGGTTWIEFFALFDTTAARPAAGGHVKDPEAAARAEKRKAQKEGKAKKIRTEDATVKPTIEESWPSSKLLYGILPGMKLATSRATGSKLKAGAG